jgi:hypothetical protein
MKKFSVLIATATILAVPFLTADASFARRGADDGAGHVRGEGAGHASIVKAKKLPTMARRGADDGAGHVRGEGAGHASVRKLIKLQTLARRGADDGAGHVRGEGAGHA